MEGKMMKKKFGTSGLCIVLGCAIILLAGSALAKVAGPCSDCHTMHNSQNGTFDTTSAGLSLTDGPFRALTKGECVACHTGTNNGTISNNIPFVMSLSAPTYSPDYSAAGAFVNTGNTLAGGSFYWVSVAGGGDDTTGHNVSNEGLCNPDSLIGNTPPGFVDNWGGSGVGSDWGTNQLTCAGTYGCHGTHTQADDFSDISGAHHTDDSGGITGETVGLSYRFCYRILGLEYNTVGNAWEYQPTSTAHNQYKGFDRTSTTTVPNLGSTSGGDTISFLCGECHGNFHGGTHVSESSPIGENPWLRHPSDYDMSNTASGSEYFGYVGADGTSVGQYNVIAPVASENVSAVQSTVTFTGTDAIVTCLSCHRAHGTPYADLLRWDYSNMLAGSQTPSGWNNKGCFACHTTKDNGI
jgi:hypothetical protein